MNIKCTGCDREYCLSIKGERPNIICQCGERLIFPSRKNPSKTKTSNNKTDNFKNICQAENQETMIERKELAALIEISKLMVSATHKDILLNKILIMTAEVMKVEAVSIILYDKERDDMAFYMSKGPGSEEITQIRLAKGEGIAGWVFLNKKPVISQDTSKDKRFCKKVDDSVQYSSKNLMCVPLLLGNEIIGVMEAVNKKDGDLFSDFDLRLFGSIANHAGEAIEKARLLEENIKSMRLAAIGQTISSLAHCIKNILNGLSGGSYLIRKAISQKDIEKIKNGWDLVDKCVAKISDLSLNMLAYSKERKPHYQLVNINSIIEEVVHMLSKRLQESKIVLTKKLNENLNIIPVDSYGIFRCLLNLITNSIEACNKENGLITITTSVLNNHNILIEIADNGPGINEENKVFSIFYSTKGNKGTGLGLAVAKKIIDEHNGHIWFETKPEIGTSFFIELPSETQIENN